jgi:hypothetical protein
MSVEDLSLSKPLRVHGSGFCTRIALTLLVLAGSVSAQITARPLSSSSEDDIQLLRSLRAVVVTAPNDTTVIRSVAFPRGVQATALHLLQRFRRVESLSFEGDYRVGDGLVELACGVEGLKSLNLGGTAVTDDGLKPVGRIKTLSHLYLWRTNISDQGTAHLKRLSSLQVLNLWDTPTTDLTLTETLVDLRLKKLLLGTSPQPKTIFHDKWDLPGSDITAEAAARYQREHPETEVVFWDVTDSPEAPSRVRAVAAGQKLTIRRGNSTYALMIPRRDDWPSFLGPGTTGKATIVPRPMDWTLKPPSLLWQRQAGGGLSAPSISQGRLVYTERLENRYRIVCLEAATGAECWVADGPAAYTDALGYDDGPRSTPAIHNGLVYCYSAEGTLHCLQLSDGQPVWSCDTAAEYDVKPNLYGVGSSPVVFDNLLLVVVGGSMSHEDTAQAPVQAGIVAFDLRTGAEVYRVAGGRASYASIRTFQYQDVPLGVGYLREGLVLFHAENGHVLARQPWAARISGCVNAATPLVDENRVFISEAYGPGSCLTEVTTVRSNEAVLRTVWQDPPRSRQRALRAHWATPVLHEGFLYGCSGRHSPNAELRCVDWKTGEVKWRESLRQLSSVCQVGNQLINLTEDGRLQLINLNPDHCDPQGSFRPGMNGRNDRLGKDPLLKFPAWTAPVIAGDALFVRGKDRIAAFRLIQGR